VENYIYFLDGVRGLSEISGKCFQEIHKKFNPLREKGWDMLCNPRSNGHH